MHRAYTNAYGTTIVREENKEKTIRDTHDKIEEELMLENEIEIIEANIDFLNQEKESLGTIESTKKAKITSIIINFFIFIGGILLGQILGTFLGTPTNEFIFNKYCFNVNIMTLLISPYAVACFFGFSISDFRRYHKKEANIEGINTQLDFLSTELSKKREELAKIREESQTVTETNGDIKILENSAYRNMLNNRLNLLEYIAFYKKRLGVFLANGTLNEKLLNKGISEEDISFVKEALKRVLENK